MTPFIAGKENHSHEKHHWRAECGESRTLRSEEGGVETCLRRKRASLLSYCPGNHESAGKRLSGRSRKGSPWLRKILVEAAHAAEHSKNTYLSAQYRRLAARCGKKKAMVAVGHTILVIIYHGLHNKEAYKELGGNYFDEQNRHSIEKRLIRRLEKLGYQVELQPAPQVA